MQPNERLDKILAFDTQYVNNWRFRTPNAERLLDFQLTYEDQPAQPPASAAKLPRYIRDLYYQPLLTRESEQKLFLKFNYAKYKLWKLQKNLKKQYVRSHIPHAERLIDTIIDTRNLIITSNLRLVISIAKTYMRFFDFDMLVSDGNLTLIRCVNNFNVQLGYKFSTYAVNAIKNQYWRAYYDQKRRTISYSNEPNADLFWDSLVHPEEDIAQRLTNDHQYNRLKSLIPELLDAREQLVINRRFGLNGEPIESLQAIADVYSLTKERIRQIEEIALRKLRREINGCKT